MKNKSNSNISFSKDDIKLQLSVCILKIAPPFGECPVFNYGTLLKYGKERNRQGDFYGQLCLISKRNMKTEDFYSLVYSVLSLNSYKKILDSFKVVILDKNMLTETKYSFQAEIQIYEKLKKIAFKILPNKVEFGKIAYNSLKVPDPFLSGYKTTGKNCYVLFSNGEIGYKYHNELYLLSIPAEKSSIFNICMGEYYSLDLSSKATAQKLNILGYGLVNPYVNDEIKSRLTLFEQYSNRIKGYSKYLSFLIKNKDHPIIAPYYKMMADAKKSEYEEVFSLVVKKTYRLYRTLLLRRRFRNDSSVPILKNDKRSDISLKDSNMDSTNDFIYTDYRETKGIFYTLSDENIVLSKEIASAFNIKYLKKFAYVSGELLSDYFSFLTVKIEPQNKQIHFKYYNTKWNEIILPVNIAEYIVSIDSVSSGILGILWNIVAVIAQKIYISEKHTGILYNYNDTSKKRKIHCKKQEQIPVTNSTVIEVPISHTISSNSDVLVVNHNNLNNILSEKNMHYRKGHWHYYWYGARNSVERHKELKWVEGTIINRETANIVIVL